MSWTQPKRRTSQCLLSPWLRRAESWQGETHVFYRNHPAVTIAQNRACFHSWTSARMRDDDSVEVRPETIKCRCISLHSARDPATLSLSSATQTKRKIIRIVSVQRSNIRNEFAPFLRVGRSSRYNSVGHIPSKSSWRPWKWQHSALRRCKGIGQRHGSMDARCCVSRAHWARGTVWDLF